MSSKFFSMNDDQFLNTESNKKSSSYTKTNYLKPNVGENKIRLLPPFKENGLPFVVVVAHTMLSLRNDEYGTIQTVNPVCLDFLFSQKNVEFLKICIEKDIIKADDHKLYRENKGCPICQIAQHAWKIANQNKDKGNKENYKTYSDLAKRASTNEKYFFNVLDRSDDTVKVYNCSSHIFEEVKKEFKLCKDEGVNIFDPNKGRDAILTKKVSGARTSYDIAFERKNSKIGADVELYNLDNIAAYGVKDYITMLDVISSTESLGSYVKQHKINFIELLD